MLEAREPSAQYSDDLQPAVLQQFELLATAPEGVAKFRELVLTLAVQGKLVQQNAADEPASRLLERIASEKQRLLQRTRAIEPISEGEQPFTLPTSWTWARLPEVCHDFGQGVPTEEFTYIDVGAIDNARAIITDAVQVLRATDAPSRARKLVQQGTVLYSTVRPYLKNIAIVDKAYTPKAIASTAFAVLHPHVGIEGRYLLHYLRSDVFTRFVSSKMVGVAYPAINDTNFFEGIVPLPPSAEQARIVARVDELMRLCDALEAKGRLEAEQHARLLSTLLDTLTDSRSPEELATNWRRVAAHFDLLLDRPEAVDALEQTVLQLAVRGLLVRQDPADEPASELLRHIRAEASAKGTSKREKALPAISPESTPFALPKGWAWARFPELGEFGRGKSKHRPRNDPALFSPPIYPLIQTGEVARARGSIRGYHSKYSELGLAQSRLWPSGTLCITIAANIADAAVLTFDACFPDSVVGFVPASCLGGVDYFLAFMETARTHLVEFAPATAQKNINLEVLESLLIPLPPQAEIARIVARLAHLRRICADLRQCLVANQSTLTKLSEALVEQATAA